jgi:hypothetical protein
MLRCYSTLFDKRLNGNYAPTRSKELYCEFSSVGIVVCNVAETVRGDAFNDQLAPMALQIGVQ